MTRRVTEPRALTVDSICKTRCKSTEIDLDLFFFFCRSAGAGRVGLRGAGHLGQHHAGQADAHQVRRRVQPVAAADALRRVGAPHRRRVLQPGSLSQLAAARWPLRLHRDLDRRRPCRSTIFTLVLQLSQSSSRLLYEQVEK